MSVRPMRLISAHQGYESIDLVQKESQKTAVSARHTPSTPADQAGDSRDLVKESQNTAVSVRLMMPAFADQFVTQFPFSQFSLCVKLLPNSDCCLRLLVYGEEEYLTAMKGAHGYHQACKDKRICVVQFGGEESFQSYNFVNITSLFYGLRSAHLCHFVIVKLR